MKFKIRFSKLVLSPVEVFGIPSPVSRWAPVLLWMTAIFYFSSRSDPLGFLPSSEDGIEDGIDIDKLAHIGEYAGLATLLYRALTGGQQPVRDTEHSAPRNPHPPRSAPHNPHPPRFDPPSRRRAFALSFALALAYAVLDELHQNSVPGRGGELADIGYDLAGVIAALGLIWMRGRRAEGRRGRGAREQG